MVDPGILALVGVIITAAGGAWAVHRQSRASEQVSERSVARDDMESALTDQREQITNIHAWYREWIANIEDRHKDDLKELREQVSVLRERAAAAEAETSRCEDRVAALTSQVEALRQERP